MKKRIISTIIVILLVIGFYPYKTATYDDGGTKIQKALLYTHINFNQLEWWCQESKTLFFPNNKWDYQSYYTQVCENKNNKVFNAGGFEPSWAISIEDNILRYSSPETYNEVLDTIEEIIYTTTKKQDENNFYFKGENIKVEFVQENCITDWRWDTLMYTVTLIKEGDMVYRWCGYRVDKNIANDDFFVMWKEKPIKDLEKKLDFYFFEASDSREDIYFSISDIYKNYIMFQITDQSGIGFSSLFKKEGQIWTQVWEGQDIDEEICEKINNNYVDIIHWGIFADCK